MSLVLSFSYPLDYVKGHQDATVSRLSSDLVSRIEVLLGSDFNESWFIIETTFTNLVKRITDSEIRMLRICRGELIVNPANYFFAGLYQCRPREGIGHA